MVQPTGIHHIAIMTGDMKKQIEFFSDVLGTPLVAIFDMHGVPGGIHAFLKLDGGCYFSLVQLPETADIPITLGITHAAGVGQDSADPVVELVGQCVRGLLSTHRPQVHQPLHPRVLLELAFEVGLCPVDPVLVVDHHLHITDSPHGIGAAMTVQEK